jgi:hypothetical protein
MKTMNVRVGGDVEVAPEITDDNLLRSLGAVKIGKAALRNPRTRFLPWFDSYQGHVFRTLRFKDITRRGEATVITTRAISDSDHPFQERRDSSGDICLREQSWDAPPVEADLRIVLEPAKAEVDGRKFTGFRYWFEYESDAVAIHRIMDRATWEIGGNLDDATIVCRNLFDVPTMRLSRDGKFSTVGLYKNAIALPGNLWGRWTLLPAFDMQYGSAGVMLAWFDRVSLIRTAIETDAGEDWVRHVDFHYFEQSKSAQTNPKTVLWSPDVLDPVDALNLWTRAYDQEYEKARAQFDMKPEEPQAIVFTEQVWRNFRFDTTYEQPIDVAAEFGADYFWIDAFWNNAQALAEEFAARVPPEQQKGTMFELERPLANMCCTYDFSVADIFGGEAGLKRLVERTAARGGMKIMAWISAHLAPLTKLAVDSSLGHGQAGIFAARENALAPETGYYAAAWTLNLNAPIRDRYRQQIIGAAQRTGVGGYLWDSVSNMGWWQVDYSNGTMRPQFDRMAGLWSDFHNAGVRLWPEGIVSFSNQSCIGVPEPKNFLGENLGYSYHLGCGLTRLEADGSPTDLTLEILKGNLPIDDLFRAIAHGRVPVGLGFHRVPREEWSAPHVAHIKELFATYKKVRDMMHRRHVLRNDEGVLWLGREGERHLFSFKPHHVYGEVVDVSTKVLSKEGLVQSNRVYSVKPA